MKRREERPRPRVHNVRKMHGGGGTGEHSKVIPLFWLEGLARVAVQGHVCCKALRTASPRVGKLEGCSRQRTCRCVGGCPVSLSFLSHGPTCLRLVDGECTFGWGQSYPRVEAECRAARGGVAIFDQSYFGKCPAAPFRSHLAQSVLVVIVPMELHACMRSGESELI